MDFLELPHVSHRILVVDDDFMLNSLFCSFLNSKGFETLSAESLGAAINIFQSGVVVDLVLLDYELGDGFGLELFSAPAFRNYLKKPPVIMVSANDDPNFLEQCFLAGSSDYIIKPVNLFLLALKVQSLLNAATLKELISQQNSALEAFKQEAEREEAVAKFTYEYLLRRNLRVMAGISIHLQSHSSFSGDIALAKRSPSGDVFFMLADATGHGLSAAITIMPVVTIFNTMVDKGFLLPQIVNEMNKKLVNDTPADRFVAAILIEFNPAKNSLYVWNGGMPTACWVHEQKIIHKFSSTNMALGILDDSLFDANVMTMELPTSGFLCAYSDGLNEQVNRQGKAFGVARVESLITSGAENITQHLLDGLEQYADGVKYDDDVSICVLDVEKIFSEFSTDADLVSTEIMPATQQNAFLWRVKISGDNLARCEFPALSNQFLQSIAVDQKTCQKVFAIVSEMVSNGLDHGVLGLSSTIKEEPDGFLTYFEERALRLSNLSETDYIELSIDWVDVDGVKRLIVSCRDSGVGYDQSTLADSTLSRFYGRGLMMIRNLARSVEIISPGNLVKAIL